MVLDISNLLSGRIKSEMKISHFKGKFFVGKIKQIPVNVRTAISSEFGETFLNDANFIAFFKKDEIDNLNNYKKKLLTVVANAFENPNIASLNINELHDVSVGSDDDDDDDKKSYVFIKITMKD